jgi:formylglycine-generating enzyme required for sulfatase activity
LFFNQWNERGITAPALAINPLLVFPVLSPGIVAGAGLPTLVSAIVAAPADLEKPLLCTEGMVRFPGRGDWIGAPAGDGDEDELLHAVKIDEYCLDRTEVTVDQYSKCVEEPRNGLQCKPAKTGVQCNAERTDRGDHPINCIRWADADTYCKWAGGRLPTEAEWELAAKGRSPSPAPLNEVCWNGEGNDLGDGNRRETCPVKRYGEGSTDLGLFGMTGNVSEWVADWYAPFPKNEPVELNPTGPKRPSVSNARVHRGGSFLDRNPASLRLSNRSYLDATKQSERIGFRCARSPSR